MHCFVFYLSGRNLLMHLHISSERPKAGAAASRGAVGWSVFSGRLWTGAVAAGRHSHRGGRATTSAGGRSSQREDYQKAMPPARASRGADDTHLDGIDIAATAVAAGAQMQAALQ